LGYAVKEAEKCIRILLRLLIHLYLRANVSTQPPPEPKANGGWLWCQVGNSLSLFFRLVEWPVYAVPAVVLRILSLASFAACVRTPQIAIGIGIVLLGQQSAWSFS